MKTYWFTTRPVATARHSDYSVIGVITQAALSFECMFNAMAATLMIFRKEISQFYINIVLFFVI